MWEEFSTQSENETEVGVAKKDESKTYKRTRDLWKIKTGMRILSCDLQCQSCDF